ncbi:substrate-binding domain-containing protein [Bosea sp. BK604]|uniref:molybdate ABC transporter substrate-binding protein n=1 Tax=Bosea sp. BK604 TaxID=2512180 RepID=UPI001048C2C0|nr:substrate-binding domain-containing protein [Bosea sp. BK604]TCR65590.1 molybdate transport system substrate-binding protein [Bosea sp. BK604]
MPKLSILSGGAAQGLVKALEAEFTAASGYEIDGVFGAVGAMRARLAAGHLTDLVILTSAIVRALGGEGVVMPQTIVDLGGVETAIAVRDDTPAPAVADEASLRAALLAADAIYFPDPEQATAGVHFADVLRRLGIASEVSSRLRTFPNGATAMRALAAAAEARAIGCTQVTEIRMTPGVMVAATLPRGFDLKTLYTAGIIASSSQRDAALSLLGLLTSEHHARLRAGCGFV